MKIIEQAEQIDAKLLVQGQAWSLLSILPDEKINLNSELRSYVFQFRVVNLDGFAQPILISRYNFAIVPLLAPVIETVKYYVEEEPDTIKAEVPAEVLN